MLKEAFFDVCRDAKPPQCSYVSLYVSVPYYGGPEEGGWWGSDEMLVAYHRCASEEESELILSRVQELAKELSDEARRSFCQQCERECEWLESRGLESDFLPEVDGETAYFAVVESIPGQNARTGSRHYD